MSEYIIVKEPPTTEVFRSLRTRTGLSAKTKEAAELGLPNTWFGVQITYGDDVIGMGRIIGDGGCYFQVVDIAVLPEHQGKGLGKRIMATLMEHFETHAPETAYISLIADGEAKDLYAQFGFEPTAPASIGMRRWA